MLRRYGLRERGAAAVEMAIVLPLLLLLLGGVIDFGWLFFQKIVMTNAAREGARGAVVKMTDADVQARAAAAANPFTSQVTVQVNSNCLADPPPANAKADVVVSKPFHFFMLNALPGVPDPGTVDGEGVMGCV